MTFVFGLLVGFVAGAYFGWHRGLYDFACVVAELDEGMAKHMTEKVRQMKVGRRA